MKNILNYFYFKAYIFFRFLFTKLSKNFSKKLLLFFSYIAYHFGKSRYKVCKANLDLVYKESKSDQEKDEIIKASYNTLLFNLYEYLENQKASKEEILSKGTLKNEHFLFDALKQGRKIIFCSSHYGGWEFGLPFLGLTCGKLAVVARQMDNVYFQKDFLHSRERNNIIVFDKKASAKPLVSALKNNTPLMITIDQHISNGLEMEFLGYKDKVIDSTSRLALKFDALIIPAFAVMKGFRSYEITLLEPIDAKDIKIENDEEKIALLTKMQVETIEKMILKDPTQWLWQHKRWKAFYGDIYEK